MFSSQFRASILMKPKLNLSLNNGAVGAVTIANKKVGHAYSGFSKTDIVIFVMRQNCIPTHSLIDDKQKISVPVPSTA